MQAESEPFLFNLACVDHTTQNHEVLQDWSAMVAIWF